MLTLDVLVSVPFHAVTLSIGSDDAIVLQVTGYMGVAANRVVFERKPVDAHSSWLKFTFMDGVANERAVTTEYVKQAFGELLSDGVRNSLSMSTLSHRRDYAGDDIFGEQ